ncbi:hypothetical protein [Streptomyces sp. NPDC046685]|uniref:hypothetical protein n=1 Tax=Streptomyces sp. NPDC046685 TaxID=3157202 RepID=UPI00340CD164
MAIYQRTVGGHVADRVQTMPGSEEDAAYAALAKDPASGWQVVDEPKPKRAARAKGDS